MTESGGVAGPPTTRASSDDCEKYTYDQNGNRAKLMKRDGNVIAYSYDALNRMTVKDIPGGTAADVYYAYDSRGLQTAARFGSLSGQGVSNAYDGFGRLTSSTTDMGTARTIAYEWDADGGKLMWRNGLRNRLTQPARDRPKYHAIRDGRMIAARMAAFTLILVITSCSISEEKYVTQTSTQDDILISGTIYVFESGYIGTNDGKIFSPRFVTDSAREAYSQAVVHVSYSEEACFDVSALGNIDKDTDATGRKIFNIRNIRKISEKPCHENVPN